MSTDNNDEAKLIEYQIDHLGTDLHRLGNSVREQGSHLAHLAANVSSKDDFLDYRLKAIEEAEREATKSRRNLGYGILLSLVITGIKFLLER